MDIGGRKMSGFSSGVIDSFQYFGGMLAGAALGALIDKVGWGSYFYFMAPFGLIGGLIMVLGGSRMHAKRPAPIPVPGDETSVAPAVQDGRAP
jgi:OPA family glycerol-3-phosphate transporter-like MFS transporter